MANKERNKRSARKARQQERAEREELTAASRPKDAKLARKQDKDAERSQKAAVKTNANDGGLVARVRNYFSAIRAEMHRVTWPSRTELTNYSVAVVAMLIFFGIAVWLVDTGFVALLVGLTGLRG
jgi:preprotein translocase subunit SecE